MKASWHHCKNLVAGPYARTEVKKIPRASDVTHWPPEHMTAVLKLKTSRRLTDRRRRHGLPLRPPDTAWVLHTAMFYACVVDHANLIPCSNALSVFCRDADFWASGYGATSPRSVRYHPDSPATRRCCCPCWNRSCLRRICSSSGSSGLAPER